MSRSEGKQKEPKQRQVPPRPGRRQLLLGGARSERAQCAIRGAAPRTALPATGTHVSEALVAERGVLQELPQVHRALRLRGGPAGLARLPGLLRGPATRCPSAGWAAWSRCAAWRGTWWCWPRAERSRGMSGTPLASSSSRTSTTRASRRAGCGLLHRLERGPGCSSALIFRPDSPHRRKSSGRLTPTWQWSMKQCTHPHSAAAAAVVETAVDA